MTLHSFRRVALVLLGSTSLCACSSFKPPEIDYDDFPSPAALQSDPPKAVKIVEIPKVLPLPGQLKSLSRSKGEPAEPVDPKLRIEQANAAARMQPRRAGYFNAVQVYPFSDGALYQVYAAPREITDIALQDGEQLVGSGPVAVGDTVRWIIGDTESGAGAGRRIHIMVKPTRADLATNLVINTDRRTYHIDLRATARVAMSEVSWRYADDALVAIRRTASAPMVEAPAKPVVAEPSFDLGQLHFGYGLEGDKPSWRPLRVFDDGRQVVIDFPQDLGATDLPPLFVLDGKAAVLVNYRMVGRRMLVDHLFQIAELRLAGAKGRGQVVRIVRRDGER